MSVGRAMNALLLNIMHRLYLNFAICSVALLKLFNPVDIVVNVDSELSKQKWYLITANHISYLDIVLMIHFCAARIPPPKFFLKKELIWLPFVGLCAWAMDMPFMQRYSKQFLAKNPHLKGKDIETTRRSCSKFINTPTTVINFVEGTRFTQQKHQQKQSPYSHLLRPKAGGVAFTLSAMGELFDSILDVTLAYPSSSHPMMDMLCGNMSKIIIDVRAIELSQELIGDYTSDEQFQSTFQVWINELWAQKNVLLRRWMKLDADQ